MTRKRRRWLKYSAVLAAVLVLLVLMLRWFEHKQVYFPYSRLDAAGSDLGRPWEDVFFQAGDGVRLNGWFFPARDESPRAHLVVLLLHGNAGNISHRLPFVEVLMETGVNVLIIDYRGYGKSEGRPAEEGTYLDAQAAYGWLRSKGFAATNIIALGKSLGGAVAAELALREKLGGLILQSTFTSIPDIGKEIFPFLPVKLLASIRYNSVAKLPRINVPVAILHSQADEIIRFHHGERLFAAANEPRLFWEVRGLHNETLLTDRAGYREGVERFLKMLERERARE